MSNLLFVFFIIFPTIVTSLYPFLGQVGTNIVIPLGFIFFYFMSSNKNKLLRNQIEVKLLILLLIVSFLSFFYSSYPEYAFLTNKKMFICFLYAITVFGFASKSYYRIILCYKAYFLCLIFLLFNLTFYFFDFNSNTLLLADEYGGLDRNAIGYFCFVGLFAMYNIYDYYNLKNKKIFHVSFFYLLPSIILYFILYSESRGGLVVIFLYIIFNSFAFVFERGFFVKILIICLIATAVYNILQSDFFMSTSTFQRFQIIENEVTPREFHIIKSIEVWLDNPFFGIGAGGYARVPKFIEFGSFSHNSVTEILANYGVFGFFIFSSIFILLFKKYYALKKVINSEDSLILYRSLVFLIFFIIYMQLYVVYLTSLFLGSLVLLISQLNFLQKKHQIR